MPRFRHGLTAFVLLATLPPVLLAQPSRPAPPASASPAASAPASSEEAQRRYTRALELFNEGSYDAALLEFRRAYELAPSWRILYNIGQVNVQLNDYARALEAFERYLSEGGAEVPAARGAEVKTQVERLRGRVAQLDITADVPGAEISIDDLPVGKTPLAQPIRVNVGRRKVAVTAAGLIPQSRIVEAAGSDKIKLEFTLRSPEASPSSTASPSASVTGAPTAVAPSRHIFWPGWIATGVLGVGAAVTGILSLSATSDYDSKLDTLGVSRDELDDARKRSRNLSLTTDILTGATILAGGVSLYLSLRTPSAPATTTTSSLGLRVGPSAVSLAGSF